MKLHDLFEKAQTDLSMAREARALAYEIGKSIYNGKKSDYFIELEGYGEFLVFDGPSVGLYPNIAVLFGKYKPNAVGMSGAVYRFEPDLVLEGHEYRTGIVIYGLRKVEEGEVKTLVNSTKFYEVMRHELMHVYDKFRTKDAITVKGGVDASKKNKYYNDPAEFNAYYHEVVSNLTDVINEIKDTPQHKDDLMGLYGFTGDFKTDLESMLKPISSHVREFLKWLRERRRKALIRRIYKLYQELLTLIQAEPPKLAE